jgi:hypothetical protein
MTRICDMILGQRMLKLVKFMEEWYLSIKIAVLNFTSGWKNSKEEGQVLLIMHFPVGHQL